MAITRLMQSVWTKVALLLPVLQETKQQRVSIKKQVFIGNTLKLIPRTKKYRK
ncbi:hypothetical protein FLJC2902T_05560 [Flavobacterium limnosediminis JC2902]|uniref:Uncharacterized protein n=1 Tax=Flavobacterium limnosediminis JC2902 TaxID=1341181 RepID=V6STN0_9FLAO|nr:hypothetical protein FLJC2902T_05560 [Flavobacterium limnosediminis JC2902]